MRTKTWVGIAALVMCGIGFTARAADDKDTSSLVGQKAPEFTLKTTDDKDAKLSDQKGKVVVVDMWATWCPPCRKSLPHVQELSANKELAGKGLVVWAVNAQEDKDTVAKFVKENKYTFTVPMDSDGKTGTAYLVSGIPTTVIVGRDGTIKSVFIGFGPKSAEQIDKAVADALKEEAPK